MSGDGARDLAALRAAEALLREWLAQWRDHDDMPPKMADALHVRTALYLEGPEAAALADRPALREALERVRALGDGWVGFDDSHHYGDALLKAIGPEFLADHEPRP